MNDAELHAARAAAIAAARNSYGRLLSWLAWQWRDIAAAEDALADAFAAALASWPRDGVPDSAEAWLLTAARRNLLKAERRRRQAEDPKVRALFPDEEEESPIASAIPDNRLRLMFVCAHPAIDPTIRSALMLQTVQGFDAARIAEAFLVSPEAMSKRLSRAKAKIKASGIRFEEPGADELDERVGFVLDAIYGTYSLQWGLQDALEAEALANEAVFLAELVAARLSDEAEASGLLALLLLGEGRRPARLDESGEFVPLEDQDPKRWNPALIRRGRALLAHAATRGDPGPFQIEAAIHAAHCHRLEGHGTPWPEICVLYERLIELHPSTGARIARAVAVSQAFGNAAQGLSLLDAIQSKTLNEHQPWWAARAHLLSSLPGRKDEALDAYGRALAITREPALRRHLSRQVAQLRGSLH